MKENLTLLYVEDDKIVRENFTEIFKTYFENVLTTDDGNHALELYQNNKVDVAILDISIHGINGLSVASKIRELDENIVILMISAYSDNDKLLRAINLKLIGYLVKPVTHKDLSTAIDKIMGTFKHSDIIELSDNFKWGQKKKLLFYKDEEISLTKNEIKTIQILLDNSNNFMNSCQIHDILFEGKESVAPLCNNVTQLISRLKKKLLNKTHSSEIFIENCYGLGYKLTIK